MGGCIVTKQLIKKLKTKNHALAFRTFKKYNDPDLKNHFATIAKKKGGDNSYTYVVSIYLLNPSMNSEN